jgi:hypothetical protein
MLPVLVTSSFIVYNAFSWGFKLCISILLPPPSAVDDHRLVVASVVMDPSEIGSTVNFDALSDFPRRSFWIPDSHFPR